MRTQRYSLQQRSGPNRWVEVSQHRYLKAAAVALQSWKPGDQADARIIDRHARLSAAMDVTQAGLALLVTQ